MRTTLEFDNMAEFLDFYREQFGSMTLYRQAQILKINRSNIKRWLDGSATPSPESVKRIGELIDARIFIR